MGKSTLQITLLLAVTLSIGINQSKAQVDPWADEVVFVSYGEGAGFGQDYFPDNVLGRPDTTSLPTVPSHTQEELLTLGGGGVIILAFRDGGIVNGEGDDFTIFENPFVTGNGTFSEPGIVAVSEDNISWHEFPYDVETGDGLAGMTPTNGAEDPTNPAVSGGDSFNLSTLGLDLIVYVRITDIGAIGGGNSVGFDLDAVVAVNGETGTSSVSPISELPVTIELNTWPNPFNSSLNISVKTTIKSSDFQIFIFNINGRLVQHSSFSGSNWSWKADNQPSGQYLIQVRNNLNESINQRVVLVR